MKFLSPALRILATAMTLGSLAASMPQGSGEAHWPTWRGPDGTGATSASNTPTSWSEDTNIRWKLEVPGRGSSTPVAWGDFLYLTTAVETDRMPEGSLAPKEEEEEDQAGRRRGRGRSAAPSKIHEFLVMAVNRKTGAVAWQTKVTETVPHEGGHPTNTLASASPVTDGERIYAFFGSRGLHCLDMQGKLLWSRNFGKMSTRNEFGEGASPAIYGETLVLVWDHEGDDFISALNTKTGEDIWRVARDEPTAWTTPLIVPVGDSMQVIVTGTGASRGYDLKTGKEIWQLAGMTTNCIPASIHQDGRLWMMSGYRGAALQAIDLEGAKGDLAMSDNLAWSYGSNTSYVPSALLHEGNLYFLRGNTGVLSCVDAGTGDVRYSGQRVGEIRSVYSSPISVGNLVYVTSREGLTVVFEAGESYNEIGANQLNDTFDASPLAIDDALFLRGWQNLYCIAKGEK
ncbi:MAG: outer membrane protein assembly factor BamB [Planctomycetota bacterium]|jgi:outer membrane protein assembly factor BamB